MRPHAPIFVTLAAAAIAVVVAATPSKVAETEFGHGDRTGGPEAGGWVTPETRLPTPVSKVVGRRSGALSPEATKGKYEVGAWLRRWWTAEAAASPALRELQASPRRTRAAADTSGGSGTDVEPLNIYPHTVA